ncbi:MAG TPA: aldo/keto reductase [Kineosporiaceae bacterium]|nr:aldo/keto reductase [Kineosporiaceae bacterium]
MRTTTLGSRGPEIGVIGLGCMGMTFADDMATPWDDETSIAVVRRALDLGMTLVDTADVDGRSPNEELVGRALVGGYRERAVLATTVGLLDRGSVTATTPRTAHDGSPEHVRRSIDDSLRRLGSDHVDLYQLHRIDPGVPLEETWGAMAQTVAAGKARTIGLSEASVEEIRRAQSVHPVTSVRSELSLWTRGPLAAVLPYCQRQGIALLALSPLGRGFLGGRFATLDDLPGDDVRRRLPRLQGDALRVDLGILDRVQRVATRVAATPAQVALAWVLAQGRYVVPVPGTRTPRYLDDNAGAADVRLSSTDLAELDTVPVPQGERY